MDTLQRELNTSFPQYSIALLGVNDWTGALGNESATRGRDLPWLQDMDADGNGVSDLRQLWGASFRDVVILNAYNEKIDTFNLSAHDLGDPKAYGELREKLMAAAVPEPSALVLLLVGLISVAFFRRR